MIGVALINVLIEKNIEVVLLVRNNSRKKSRIPKSDLIKTYECDLSRLYEFNGFSDVADVVFHLGWEGTTGIARSDILGQLENVRYIIEAVKLAKRCGCSTFVGVGSQAEYGRVYNKVASNNSVNPDTPYGNIKYTAGRISGVLCKELSIKHMWARVFSAYGKYDGYNTLMSV